MLKFVWAIVAVSCILVAIASDCPSQNPIPPPCLSQNPIPIPPPPPVIVSGGDTCTEPKSSIPVVYTAPDPQCTDGQRQPAQQYAQQPQNKPGSFQAMTSTQSKLNSRRTDGNKNGSKRWFGNSSSSALQSSLTAVAMIVPASLIITLLF